MLPYIPFILLCICLAIMLWAISRKANLHIAYLAAINNGQGNDFSGLFKMIREPDTMINPLHLLWVICPVFWGRSKWNDLSGVKNIKQGIYKQLGVFYGALAVLYLGMYPLSSPWCSLVYLGACF